MGVVQLSRTQDKFSKSANYVPATTSSQLPLPEHNVLFATQKCLVVCFRVVVATAFTQIFFFFFFGLRTIPT